MSTIQCSIQPVRKDHHLPLCDDNTLHQWNMFTLSEHNMFSSLTLTRSDQWNTNVLKTCHWCQLVSLISPVLGISLLTHRQIEVQIADGSRQLASSVSQCQLIFSIDCIDKIILKLDRMYMIGQVFRKCYRRYLSLQSENISEHFAPPLKK